jgi:succinate dehydrogenase/fumarate reductase flavoprotein subunit
MRFSVGIIGTGDGYAVASKAGMGLEGTNAVNLLLPR